MNLISHLLMGILLFVCSLFGLLRLLLELTIVMEAHRFSVLQANLWDHGLADELRKKNLRFTGKLASSC